jgi:hypothetical protein
MILQPKVWMTISRGEHGRRLRLSAAHNEWNHVGIALLAMEEGFFAEEGLTDVELITFDKGSSELLNREARQAELLAEGAVTSASTRAPLLFSRRKTRESRCASWPRDEKITPSC